jgi:tetratricopeptide (TPR) repeat protein
MTIDQLTTIDKALLEEAFTRKNEERYPEALHMLLNLEVKYPDIAVLSGTIASCYYLMTRYRKAEMYFRKTTVLNPASELASRGLFHSLWQQARFTKALEEMDRYLSANNPVRTCYRITLEELSVMQYLSSRQTAILSKYVTKYVHTQG